MSFEINVITYFLVLIDHLYLNITVKNCKNNLLIIGIILFVDYTVHIMLP